MFFYRNQIFQKLILTLFLVVSFGSLFCGLSLVVLDTPQSKADAYLSVAHQYSLNARGLDLTAQKELLAYSETLTLRALSFAPYEDMVWSTFLDIKENQRMVLQAEKENNFAFSNLR